MAEYDTSLFTADFIPNLSYYIAPSFSAMYQVLNIMLHLQCCLVAKMLNMQQLLTVASPGLLGMFSHMVNQRLCSATV